MAEDTRELDQIQNDIETLHERSQSNKANISAHEAVCEERYAQIIATMQDLKDELKTVHLKLNEVSELANQGRTSLKTLLWVGGAVAGITAFIAMIINMLPK
jgi:seryl-tRNA synthetase